jgi:prepilin-type N-terminal cleavage/methylation domain-containing protein
MRAYVIRPLRPEIGHRDGPEQRGRTQATEDTTKMMLGRVPRHLSIVQLPITGGGRVRWRSRGFSLVELLVAATILAVGLLGILTAFPVSHRDIVYGGRVSQAVALAQQRMEQLKAGNFPPANGNETSGLYTINWTVSSVGVGAAVNDLRKVTVNVTWTQSIRPGRYDLEGFVSKPY